MVQKLVYIPVDTFQIQITRRQNMNFSDIFVKAMMEPENDRKAKDVT